MNDVKSLLIATTVLAIGGLGLYMYKDSELDYDNDDDNNDNFSDSDSELESGSGSDSELEELDYNDYRPKKTKKEGTKKNNKKHSGTRKKY